MMDLIVDGSEVDHFEVGHDAVFDSGDDCCDGC